MEQVTNATEVIVKIDSKGRICIPAEIREQIGNLLFLAVNILKLSFYGIDNSRPKVLI